MELFYLDRIEGDRCFLSEEESAHCVRVMRHRDGDRICVADGCGTMYECVLEDASPRAACLRIEKSNPGWGSHGYHLTMAVCLTKNTERFEWFVEKAVELGIDRIVPIVAEHSERRVFRRERLQRLVLAAAKQSLKASVPVLDECTPIAGFLNSGVSGEALRLIACCFDSPSHGRVPVTEALKSCNGREIVILIGPEGDFSPAELETAFGCGFLPVSLGGSRLRTETAALASVAAVYFNFL